MKQAKNTLITKAPITLFVLTAAVLGYFYFSPNSPGESPVTTTSMASSEAHQQTQVVINTSLGPIELTLYDNQAPLSVENFIKYADSGFYNNTLFHRVIPGFMIQGGGFEAGMTQKPTNSPIKNEAKPNVPNLRGTIAMARTNNPDSATSQFFINLEDNHFLNKKMSQAGYAVFGRVTKGMEIVDAISKVQTGRRGPYADVPEEDILILDVTRINKEQ